VAGSHIDTIRAYWDATERADWETAARRVGGGFTLCVLAYVHHLPVSELVDVAHVNSDVLT